MKAVKIKKEIIFLHFYLFPKNIKNISRIKKKREIKKLILVRIKKNLKKMKLNRILHNKNRQVII
jgi:hypothetical protein